MFGRRVRHIRVDFHWRPGLNKCMHPGIEYVGRSSSDRDRVELLKNLLEDEAEEEEPQEAERIYCRQCLKMITSPEERITVEGAHQHTFANPYGIVFEIGCFRTAQGCGHTGVPTSEFSWFKGFSWQVAVCHRCLLQVGWRFTSVDADGFYGLILNRLIFPK